MRRCISICLVLAFLIAGISLQALADAPWAMHCANSARTGQSTYPGPGAELDVAWTTPAAPYSCDSFAVAPNGTLLWLARSEARPTAMSVVAYDRFGAFLWEGDLGFGGTYCPFPSLAIADGVVYAGVTDTLFGFTLSGQKVFEFTVPELYDTLYFLPPAIGPGGDVIVPIRRSDGLDAPVEIASIGPDGAVKWTVNLGMALGTLIAVSEDGRVVAAGYTGWIPWLVCVGSDGNVAWAKRDLAQAVTPRIDDPAGWVLMPGAAVNEGAVLAIDLEDGAVAWTFRAPTAGASNCCPDAFDADRGICYVGWCDCGPTDSTADDVQYFAAVDRGGNLLWSKMWANSRSTVYSYGGGTVDGEGLVYSRISCSEYRQGVFVGETNNWEVYSPAGDVLAARDCTDLPLGVLAVGADRRLYLLTEDDSDTETTCVVYVLGAPAEEAPVYRPSILSAGYGFSRVTSDAGGVLTINAKVSHPLGASNIEAVEVRLCGVPTGLCLLPGGKSDGEYNVSIDLPGGFVPAGQFLLELVARDKEGRTSDVWPYMTVAAQ